MFIHIVVIAWLYVALMMALAEGMGTQGTVLGAVVSFVFYGLLPVALVVYILATPARKRALRAQKAAEDAARSRMQQAQQPAEAARTDAAQARPASASDPPDQRREAPAGRAVAPVREEA